MASDFGDESGEKILDDAARLGLRAGEDAVRKRQIHIAEACRNAEEAVDRQAEEALRVPDGASEWAKLDMSEFAQEEGYEETKAAIEGEMDAQGVETAWFADQANGKEYLLFRVKDAPQVKEGLESVSKKTLNERDEPRGEMRDERPLELRAEQARRASEALESERAKGRVRAREPRFQENRTR